MTIKTTDNSPRAILQRLDAILDEVLALRQDVQKMIDSEQHDDLVATLSGSLGPAAPDESTYFNQFDLEWQRFADEPVDQ